MQQFKYNGWGEVQTNLLESVGLRRRILEMTVMSGNSHLDNFMKLKTVKILILFMIFIVIATIQLYMLQQFLTLFLSRSWIVIQPNTHDVAYISLFSTGFFFYNVFNESV